MPKRSTRFYRRNEEKVMHALGFNPTKNSGAGWIEKEDGQNDYLICQLKSTDARSISVKQDDIRILEHNAAVSHKLPVFAIQFLNTGEVWLMAKPEDFCGVSEYIQTGECKKLDVLSGIDFDEAEETTASAAKTIRSSKSARESFHKEKDKTKEKRTKEWKAKCRSRQ